MATEIGMTLLYVQDVQASIGFYEEAFGLERDAKVPAELGDIFQRSAGSTLGFVQRDFTEDHVGGVARVAPERDAPPVIVLFAVPDVDAAYRRAIDAGARSVRAPEDKPLGFRVAYVRDRDGFLVELATPIAK
jgi:lactoylglutathione lyase